KIRRYYARGGNLLVLGEPDRRDVVNPIIEGLGVRLVAGQPRAENALPLKYGRILASAVKRSDSSARALLRRRAAQFDHDWLTNPDLLDEVKGGIGFKVCMPSAAAVQWQTGGPYAVHTLIEQSAERPQDNNGQTTGEAIMIAMERTAENDTSRMQR